MRHVEKTLSFNALTGDNMSAMQTDHRGPPFTGDANWSETVRQALSPCKQKMTDSKWKKRAEGDSSVSFCCPPEARRTERGVLSEVVGCFIKTQRRLE